MKHVLLILLIACAALCAGASTVDDIPTRKVLELTTKNTVFLTGEIEPVKLMRLADQIKANPNLEYLVIHSPGGYTLGIDTFADVVSAHPRLKVVVAFAASAAAAIAQMVKVPVYILPSGGLVFHRIRSPAWGDNRELIVWEERLRQLRISDNWFTSLCLTRMNISRPQFDLFTVGKDWYLPPFGAVQVNAADEIVEAKCSKGLHRRRHTVESYTSRGLKMQEICNILN